MRARWFVLVWAAACLAAGCGSGSKPTDAMKPGQEKKPAEQLKRKAPED